MAENFGEFIARLTDNARTSLQHAEAIARGQGSSHIGTEHLLLGVLAQGSSVGAKLLADAGVTLQRAELALNLSPRTLVIQTNTKGLSETALLTLKMAYEHAKELHQQFLGTEHILYSILRQKSSRGSVLLRDMSTDIDQLIEELEAYFDRQQGEYEELVSDTEAGDYQSKKAGGLLGTYGTDLTDKARAHSLDAVIGRHRETERRDELGIGPQPEKGIDFKPGRDGPGLQKADVNGTASRVGSCPKNGNA